jgi:hypothetical protein
MPTARRQARSHRLAGAVPYVVLPACALRFAPVCSSGFRMPCRGHAVELAGGQGASAGVGLCAPASRPLTRLAVTQPAGQSEIRKRPAAARPS